MATGEQIITGKPYVETLGDEDALFVNQGNTLRQIKKKKAGFITTENLEEEVAPMVYGAYINKSVSGSIVSFSDGGDGVPMKKCLVNITPKQSGTGTPSPDNVRQISGWESVVTSVRNKNLLTMTNTETVSGVTYTPQSDGSIKAVGTSTGTYPKYIWTDGKRLPAGNYMMSAGDEVTANGVRLTCAIKRVGGNTQYYECTSDAEKPFTVYADDISMSVYMRTAGGSTAINATVYPMIRLASDTDPAYEPYTGTTTTTALGRTVYGGTLDVVSGALTVDRAYHVLSNTHVGNPMGYKAGYAKAYIGNELSPSAPSETITDIVCNMLVGKNVYSLADSGLYIYSGTNIGISVPFSAIDGYSDISDNSNYSQAITKFLTDNQVQIVYPIATPQTYTLTPTQVSTLLGENNVWADAGDVEVTYRADPTLAYQELANAVIALGGNV